MTVYSLNRLIDLISTSQAIYGDFSKNLSLIEILAKDADFTKQAVDNFEGRYEVASHFETKPSGFQAILFRDKIDNKYVFAIRGSEQIAEDFAYADGGDIGRFGFAAEQAADMYRYWKKLTTPLGEQVTYSNQELAQLYALTNLPFVISVLAVPVSGLLSLLSIFSATEGYANLVESLSFDVGLGAISAVEKVDVTGHSLGGNLANVFASMFPNNIDKVVTINAPSINGGLGNIAGFGVTGQDILRVLGFSGIDQGRIISLTSEGDLVHLTSGSQIGTVINISQEVGHGVFDGFANNHSVINGLDSLNVMNLFAKLDVTQADKPSGILVEVMRASSNVKENTYENMVDALRYMMLGGVQKKTEASTKNDLDKRGKLYSNMGDLEDSLGFKDLVGRVKIVKVSEDPYLGASDYGQFLSLYFLAPFSLSGNEDDLKKLNPDLYELWQKDKNLTEEEQVAGKQSFSEAWYQDRSAMLAALISRNLADEENDKITNTTSSHIQFSDAIVGQEVYSTSKKVIADVDVVAFGGDKIEILNGFEFDDRLYGGGGNDTLYGRESFDYLEGNAGNDLLYGGDDADHLVGGIGDDQIVREGGNDILEGGQGNDTYAFTGQFGHDIIKDSDGNGSIVISGVTLSQLTQSAKDSIIYYDNLTNPTRKAVLIHEGDTNLLIISTVTKVGNDIVDSGNSVTIKNWNNSLGITLQDAPAVAPDTNVFVANDITHKNSLTYSNAFDSNPNALLANYTAISATGTANNDLLMGLNSGKDTLSGGAGNDVISSGFTGVSDYSINSAYVTNTPGADSIDGGAGDDYIVATAGAIAHGGDNNDVLDAGKILFLTTGTDQANRDKIWQDLQQIIDLSPVVKNANSSMDLGTGLKFNKNLTATYTVFPSAITGKKFIAKYQDNKVWIAYLDTNQAVDNNVTYDNVGLWQFGESSIVPASGHTYEEFADRPGANLFGDTGDDYLFGGINADYLSGGEGKDTIMGGEGNDVIDGGSENDSIAGSEGNDLISGGAGNDTLWGSKGSARASAADSDTLYGGSGNDIIYADNGNDYVDAGSGADELNGGIGDDYLYGGDDQEKDFLYGGSGNDTIVIGQHDEADGGAGKNIYIWDTHRVTTTNVNPAATAQNQNNTTSSTTASAFLGFAAADTLPVNQTQTLEDVIYISNAEGNNTLGIAGASDFSGFDVDLDTSGNYLVLTNSDGNRIAIEDYSKNSPLQFAFGHSIEQLANTSVVFDPLTDDHFLNGVDPLSQAQVTSADVTLAKLETSVEATGIAGGYLAGGLRNDVLTANVAGSKLIGGEGDDQYNGDVGNDTYLIRKGDGADTISEKGGLKGIKLDNNALLTVNGTAGNDLFKGSTAKEVLKGGLGDDQLEGGLGNDTYHYAKGDGKDVIVDLNGTDTLEFTAGVLASDLQVRSNGKDLLLTLGDGGSIKAAA